MKKLKFNINKKVLWISVSVILVLLSGVFVYSYWPTSRNKMPDSMAIVENLSCYRLILNEKDTLYFNGIGKDSLLTDLSSNEKSIRKIRYSVGCWIHKYALLPSCFGRLLTTTKDENTNSVQKTVTAYIDLFIQKELVQKKQLLKTMSYEMESMKYYLSVHGVQDEGFNSISQHYAQLNNKKDSTARIIQTLSRKVSGSLVKVTYLPDYFILYHDKDHKLRREHCHPISAHSKMGFRMIRTDSRTTPSYARPQHFHHWFPWYDLKGKRIFIAAYGGLDEESFEPAHAIGNIQAGKLKGNLGKQAGHTITASFAQNGSPVFSRFGFFLGVNYQGQVIHTSQFHFNLRRLE